MGYARKEKVRFAIPAAAADNAVLFHIPLPVGKKVYVNNLRVGISTVSETSDAILELRDQGNSDALLASVSIETAGVTSAAANTLITPRSTATMLEVWADQATGSNIVGTCEVELEFVDG